MKPELLYLTLAAALTGLLWVPYILDRVAVGGLADAVGYPAAPKPQSPWAVRLMKAHHNAVENLVVFAALVLTAQAAGVSNGATATACVVYFWARVVHALAYTLAWPWVRTLAFAVGFFCQATIAWQLLAR
ncbi:MAG TPA: MAPEG family protein [Ideonella sp.]|nr:MAPEG family protein [Ideonella sp.]